MNVKQSQFVVSAVLCDLIISAEQRWFTFRSALICILVYACLFAFLHNTQLFELVVNIVCFDVCCLAVILEPVL